MIRSDDDDVPSPIDFHDLEQAREWEANTIKIRHASAWAPTKIARNTSRGISARPIGLTGLGSSTPWSHIKPRMKRGIAATFFRS